MKEKKPYIEMLATPAGGAIGICGSQIKQSRFVDMLHKMQENMFTQYELEQIEYLASKEIEHERQIMHERGQMRYGLCEKNINVLESIIEKVRKL